MRDFIAAPPSQLLDHSPIIGSNSGLNLSKDAEKVNRQNLVMLLKSGHFCN
jgi:hypothetical protein